MYFNMNKFFFKVFSLLAIIYITVSIYIEFFPMYYNSVDNTRWYYFRQIFERKITIDQSSSLFLGDSRLNTNVSVKQINDAWSFAAGGSSPIEMYYALKNYLNIYNKPDTVFVSFSPRTFIEAYSFWGYAVRNDYLSAKQVNEVFANLTQFKEDTVLGNSPRIVFWLYKLDYIKYYQTDLYKNHVFLAKFKNEQIISHFQTEKGIWNYPNLKNGCAKLNYETHLKSFKPSKLLQLYFVKILDLCKKENIHLIFDFMPMNESSYNKLNKQFISGYKSDITKIAHKYPKFTISDTVYSYKDEYFGDESHLNAKGKKIFTEYILRKYFRKN